MKRFQVIVDPDLEPIMGRYMELQFQDLENLEKAIESQDGESIRMLGHKIKGSGASYGFEVLTYMGADMEEAGLACEFGKAHELQRRIREYLENVEIRYGEE